jgi:hypothetical protein
VWTVPSLAWCPGVWAIPPVCPTLQGRSFQIPHPGSLDSAASVLVDSAGIIWRPTVGCSLLDGAWKGGKPTFVTQLLWDPQYAKCSILKMWFTLHKKTDEIDIWSMFYKGEKLCLEFGLLFQVWLLFSTHSHLLPCSATEVDEHHWLCLLGSHTIQFPVVLSSERHWQEIKEWEEYLKDLFNLPSYLFLAEAASLYESGHCLAAGESCCHWPLIILITPWSFWPGECNAFHMPLDSRTPYFPWS